jgi:methionine-rich copper-binding protein CopC
MKIPSLISISTFLLAATTLARAHAFLDTSEPAVGATVNAPPAQVKIWFTERLQHAASTIQVFDATGREVDRQNVKVNEKNEQLMTVSLPKLPPGTYKVVWSAVALDTHHTHGDFTFTVKAP